MVACANQLADSSGVYTCTLTPVFALVAARGRGCRTEEASDTSCSNASPLWMGSLPLAWPWPPGLRCRCVVVCCGVVWCGVVWCGVVWCVVLLLLLEGIQDQNYCLSAS